MGETSRSKPIVAILTIADNQRVFRGNKQNFIDIIKIGEELGTLVYVATTADLKLTGDDFPAYCYNVRTKKWQRRLVPMPHVIYNRVPYRKMEMQPDVQQTIQTCLKSRKVQLFNPAFFNKWSLFEWLNQTPDTRIYIPKTRQLSDVRQFESFVRSHDIVYLKPARGKAGRGIMRIERLQPGVDSAYLLRVQDDTAAQDTEYASIAELWPRVRSAIGTKEYIMQQGIRLARYNKRPFDLRTLVQKTGRGAWNVTGVGARIAGKASITTHVPRGGSINDPQRVLVSAFGAQEADRILNRVNTAALRIASRIEKQSGHKYGEMSMDLGVDTSGRVWFFEANAKPMKFDEPHIRRKSLERIIRYAVYLAKKNKRR
ncbi:endospore coat-associated protein [Gordoniibacillus kamchatkensis]|uniref:Endospore coat-associated protein n=1 Tax=Gordoniibacillus kamchatkensis TaxID=1590651 RepID=A0ABR5ANC7_9BACL|nr:endospore coat-associated protein [Paenibacillus sp. VKM B-2647]